MINFKPFQQLYQQVKAKDVRLFETLDKISSYLQSIGNTVDSFFNDRGDIGFVSLSLGALQTPNIVPKVIIPRTLGDSNITSLPNGNAGIDIKIPTYKLDVLGDINTSTIYRVSGTQVVGAQLPAIASPTLTAVVPTIGILTITGTAGGTYTVTEQGMINNLKTGVNDLNTDVTNIGVTIAALITDVATLKSTVDTLRTRLLTHGLTAT